MCKAVRYQAERDFIQVIEAQGKTWEYEPVRFKLLHPLTTFIPDFYVPEDRMFYEVAGTKQAYDEDKAKIEAFKILYPQMPLKVVHANGTECVPIKNRKIKLITSYGRKFITKYEQYCTTPEKQRIFEHIKNHSLCLKEFEKQTGTTRGVLINFLKSDKKSPPKSLYGFLGIPTPEQVVESASTKPVVEDLALKKIINNGNLIDLEQIEFPKFYHLLLMYIAAFGGIDIFAKRLGVIKSTVQRWLALSKDGIDVNLYGNKIVGFQKISSPVGSDWRDDSWKIWPKALLMDHPDNERYEQFT